MENKIIKEVRETLESIDESSYRTAIALISEARHVFVAGAGRSRLIGSCFALRLRHLAIESYVAGDTICPAAGKGDLLIIISSSGDKQTLISLLDTAKQNNAVTLCVTAKAKSDITRRCDQKIIIPVKESIQFGSSLFEQTALIFLDTVSDLYRVEHKISARSMWNVHANLE